MKKSKILVTALALSIVAILSVGTLAWFSAEQSVTNQFFFADSEETDPDEIFSVDVWEENRYGDESEGIWYKDILPGDTLVKKAFVKNTGHYDQYIRVIVTISDATAWLNAVGEDINMSTVVGGFNEADWMKIEKGIYGETDTIQYVLYYKDVLKYNETIQVFDEITIPSSLTQEQASAFEGGFTIDVKAQAVQTKNVGNNAVEAFATVGMGL